MDNDAIAPIGATVRLTDGRTAVVVGHDRAAYTGAAVAIIDLGMVIEGVDAIDVAEILVPASDRATGG